MNYDTEQGRFMIQSGGVRPGSGPQTQVLSDSDASGYRGSTEQSYYQDYWADNARGWTPRNQPLHPVEAELLGQYVKPGSSVLDFGCGDGRMGIAVRDLGANYMGLDLSQAAVDSCRTRGLNAQVYDTGKTLPFADNSFDTVFIFEVLEHLFRPDYVIADIARCVRPGGCIIGSVPNVASLSNRGMLLFGAFNPGGSPETSLRAPWKDPHIRFFSRQTLQSMLRGPAGCQVAVLTGESWSLANLPIIYKSPQLIRKFLQIISLPVARIGRVVPQLFSNRLFFVAKR